MDSSRVVWRKSRRSGNGGANCVEVVAVQRSIAVRDSKNPEGTKLAFTSPEWSAFATRVKDGDFDLT